MSDKTDKIDKIAKSVGEAATNQAVNMNTQRREFEMVSLYQKVRQPFSMSHSIRPAALRLSWRR